MREIITIHVGQCGNRIGQNFWEHISQEHNISPDGTHQGEYNLKLEKIDVYFDESFKSRHIPRAVFVDLEPIPIEAVQASKLGRIFRPENFISGKNGASNLWAKGYYTEGAGVIDTIMDSVRQEVERADNVQGFQISHGLAGGTGCGLGCLIMDKLVDEYPATIQQTFSVFPSSVCANVIEPYNAIPFFSKSQNGTASIQILDNESLEKLCLRSSKFMTSRPTYQDMNQLIASAMSGMTCSFRYPGQLNSNMLKYLTHLIPFPRMRFLMCSYAPISGVENRVPTVENLVKEVFDPRNVTCNVDTRQGHFITGAVSFRGIMSSSEVEEEMHAARNVQSRNFLEWIPDSLKSSICNVPPKGVERDATFMINSTAINELFKKLATQFALMFKRKAFLHWFTSEGMDEMEFTEFESNFNDGMCEYDTSWLLNTPIDEEVWEEYDENFGNVEPV